MSLGSCQLVFLAAASALCREVVQPASLLLVAFFEGDTVPGRITCPAGSDEGCPVTGVHVFMLCSCCACCGGQGAQILQLQFSQQRASLQYRAGTRLRQDEAWRLLSVRNGVCGVVTTGASSVLENKPTEPAGRVRAREGVTCPFLDCVEEEEEEERERERES